MGIAQVWLVVTILFPRSRLGERSTCAVSSAAAMMGGNEYDSGWLSRDGKICRRQRRHLQQEEEGSTQSLCGRREVQESQEADQEQEEVAWIITPAPVHRLAGVGER